MLHSVNLKRIFSPGVTQCSTFYCTSTSAVNKMKDEKANLPDEKDGSIWVSPPHQLSNLRLKTFPEPSTIEEKEFFDKCNEVQNWNQKYWERHNREYTELRQSYVERVCKEKNMSKDETLTSDELAVFYKEFLNRNHRKHISYNWNWYKKNTHLIFLEAKVKLHKFVQSLHQIKI